MCNKDSPTTLITIGKHRVLALYKFVKIEQEKIPQYQKEIETKLRSVKARGTILIACEGINGTICYPEQLAIDSMERRTEEWESSSGSNDAVLEFLQNHECFSGLRTRLSFADTSIFHRLKVKIKNQIVTMSGEDEDEGQLVTESINADKKEEKFGENKQQEEEQDASGESLNNNSNNPQKKSTREKIKVDPTEVVGTYVKPGKEWDDLLMDPDVVVIDTRNKYEYDIGTFENAISPNTDNFRYVYEIMCVS